MLPYQPTNNPEHIRAILTAQEVSAEVINETIRTCTAITWT